MVWKDASVLSGESNPRPRPVVRGWDGEAWKMITLRPLKVKGESAMQYRWLSEKAPSPGAAEALLAKEHEPCETQA